MSKPAPVKLVKAPALRRGDLIQFHAPAYPLTVDRLGLAVERFESKGFQVSVARNAKLVHGYMAGSDQKRAKALNTAMADPEIRAIACARGGYGVMRILDRLDFEPLRQDPKVIFGYSDITALLLAAHSQVGLVGFHGPMPVVELIGPHAEFGFHWLDRAMAPRPAGEVPNDGAVSLRPGIGRGPLLGGCLSLVSHLCGTGYLPSFDGSIFFWEEVGEPPYRIDRQLTQLRLAGHLDNLAGMVVGQLTDCLPEQARPSLTVEQAILEVTAGTDYPILFGMPFGHVPRQITLPIGIQALLETGETSGRLVFEEAATRSARAKRGTPVRRGRAT